MPSSLERQFAHYIKLLGRDLPPYTAEYEFAPPRKYRLDFAWPEHRAGVEVDGGIYSRGAHSAVSNILRDIDKHNLAVLSDWRVLRVSEKMLSTDPKGCIDMVRSLLTQ